MADMPPIEEQPEEAPGKAEAKAKPNRWKPGQSGNPRGYRKGSRHRATILAETLLDGEADRITRRCIYDALRGEPVAQRLCIERLLSPLKSRPLRFKLPVLHTLADAQAALSQVVAGMADGTILIDEGQVLSNVINTFLKSIEIAEIEARLCALEQQASAEERPGVRFDA
jgi:Family of unknown function (DUF5681)